MGFWSLNIGLGKQDRSFTNISYLRLSLSTDAGPCSRWRLWPENGGRIHFDRTAGLVESGKTL